MTRSTSGTRRWATATCTQVQEFFITLVDESGETVARYFVTESWPKLITATNKRKSVERVEFPADEIERVAS